MDVNPCLQQSGPHPSALLPHLGHVELPELALHISNGDVGDGQDQQAGEAGECTHSPHDASEAAEAEQVAHRL